MGKWICELYNNGDDGEFHVEPANNAESVPQMAEYLNEYGVNFGESIKPLEFSFTPMGDSLDKLKLALTGISDKATESELFYDDTTVTVKEDKE